MKILERLRLQHQIKNIPTGTTNPLLKKQLEQTEKQLNSILNNWKFGDVPIKTSEEFLNKFGNWINQQLKDQQEVKEFLKANKVKNIEALQTLIADLKKSPEETNEELKKFLNFHKVKSLTELEQNWNNTEQDYLKKIKELEKQSKKGKEGDWEKETAQAIKDLEKENETLTTERDEAIRDKKTAEQEALSLGNKLKLKSKEADNKVKEIERLKKEKSKSEISLNKKLTELKEKYSKQGKLLDEEQLATMKLENEIEKLNKKITELEKERKELLEPSKTYQEWLDEGALNEKITSGSWNGYTYAYASKRENSSFQDDETNLTKKWKLEDLKEEIKNHLPY